MQMPSRARAGTAHEARLAYRAGPARQTGPRAVLGGFFIFIFFISVFYKNIFSIWKFTEIYPGRPAAGRLGPGRPAAGRQGLIRKKKMKINCRQIPGAGRPAAGRPPPLAARQRGGRPPTPI